jgi:hypothetical protein
MAKADAALALAKRGFKVFPIAPNAKFPPLWEGWPQRATSDAAALQNWPQDANIGVHCEGLLVIDVDVAKGGGGSLAYLQAVYDLPETLTTITPSGGKHLFYRLPKGHPGVPNSVERVAKGIDIRSDGGYVLAPGSETPAGRYRFEREAEIADAPEWLIAKAGTVVPKTGTNEPVPDAPDAVLQRAADWLAKAEPAIEGQGGDAHTFAVAARLRDFGVSEAQAVQLLLEWNGRCSPPWTPAEIGIKCRNAYQYGQNEPGVKAALPEDFPVHVEELYTIGERVEKMNKTRHVVRRLSQFANSEHRGPGYLIKGLLQRRSYAELFGQPGAGKTFVALDAAYHVAANRPWMGRKVHAGAVLYLAYEGVGGMVKRAQALRQKYGDEDVPLFIAGADFNLREQAGRQTLGGIMAELSEKPVLVVVDTFARALCGGDENSAQDVGAFNAAIAALIENTGACVMIIHHSGKNKNAGARGSSALLGAIDTELEVDENQITARKQRDVEAGEPIGFKLEPMIVGLDEDGDELTSCTVAPDEVKAGPKMGRLTGNNKRGFDVLCELRPTNDPITDVEWKEACKEFLGDRSVAQRFHDIKRNLRTKGYIEVNEEGLITRRCE